MTWTRQAVLACCLVLGACGTAHAPTTEPTHAVVAPSVSPAVTPTPSAVRTAPAPKPTRHPTASTPTPSGSPSAAPSATVLPYVSRVPLPPACLPASPAIVGVKVYLVQKRLGLVGHRERYDTATQAAVRHFQAGHGLPVDGVVGPRTWRALAIPEPYCVDQYTAQPTVGLGASPHQRVEAMIGYARSQLGTPYIWGGAGPMGFDCSGLAIQAMYAGGRRVPGLNTNLHVGANFRSTHYIYTSALMHVPFSARRRGDLIFYGNPITHMAIYLGGGRILEDVRPQAREAALFADGLRAQPLVVRPFPGPLS